MVNMGIYGILLVGIVPNIDVLNVNLDLKKVAKDETGDVSIIEWDYCPHMLYPLVN